MVIQTSDRRTKENSTKIGYHQRRKGIQGRKNTKQKNS